MHLRGPKSGLLTRGDLETVLGLFPGTISFLLQEEKVPMWGLCLPKPSGLHLNHVIWAVYCEKISSAPTSLHTAPGAPRLGFPESLGMVQALKLSC